MRGPQRHPSVGRRILDMSLTWLIVGAMIGAIGGLRTGRLVELASGVLGGMIVLPIAGVLLGLIGGDVKGSVVGAVGGLMGCWLAKPTGGISIDAVSVEVVVVFGALVGATCLLYLQFVRRSYGILLRRACQMVGGALVLGVQHAKVVLVIEIVSTNHPGALMLSSDPQSQRNWMIWPEAAEGRLTTVVIKPPELPLQACRPDSGLL